MQKYCFPWRKTISRKRKKEVSVKRRSYLDRSAEAEGTRLFPQDELSAPSLAAVLIDTSGMERRGTVSSAGGKDGRGAISRAAKMPAAVF